jgi:hypothetical protein
MWGASNNKSVLENQYGKGRVLWGITPDEALKKLNVKSDFSATATSEIDYIHRTTDFGEIYFLRNEKAETVKAQCRFRVKGMHPEIWDAATGTYARVSNYTEGEQGISIDIELPAHGSTFVVFNKDISNQLPISDSQITDRIITNIAGPWKVNFPPNWGAPPTIILDSLISWTESENQGVKYFSGMASYENSFTVKSLPGKESMVLDLGDLRDVAEVFVNEKSAGILWKKPYQVDITELVKSGSNQLKIEIVNMWSNRLTGDMLSDPKDRYCKTNQPYMKEEVWPGGDEPYKLQTAGLLGPVTIIEKK